MSFKKERGWFGESMRHSLAARGIKAGVKSGKMTISAIIILEIKKAGRPLTIKEISNRTLFSWPTVDKYIRKTKAEEIKRGSRSYWKV